MTVLGPILLLTLAAVAAVAWVVSGPTALLGVAVGIFIAAVPCWIPYQAVRRGEDHGKAMLQATGMRFLSALVVAAIAEFTQPRDVAKTFLLGMAASYLVLLTIETIYFAKNSGTRADADASSTGSATSLPSPDAQ